jgi:UDPglucose 6-dehydrogenase
MSGTALLNPVAGKEKKTVFKQVQVPEAGAGAGKRVLTVSVVGLGKLGSPLAAVLASKGHTVIGLDQNEAFVKAINAGEAPVSEPRLAGMISANRSRLSATDDYEDAIERSDLTILVVPTPSEESGFFSLKHAKEALGRVGAALRHKKKWHLVSLASTVMPGSCDKELAPHLEKASGKKCGVDFGFCYNPEFIALGSVIRDMLNPDFILIGESDKRSGDLLEGMYQGVCDNRPLIARMNWVNAELTKIAVNTFVTTKISYANMLAEVCEKLPKADVDVVTGALGMDTRIGKKYLKGALGYGGPCFPRDNVAFGALARHHGVAPLIPEATDRINHHQIDRLAEKIVAELPSGATVGILGLSYKAGSNVVEHAPGMLLARRLGTGGVKVVAHDPEAMGNARKVLGDAVTFAESADAVIEQADVVLLMTNWEEYKRLTPGQFQAGGRRRTIVDCWRMLDGEAFGEVAAYRVLGKGE